MIGHGKNPLVCKSYLANAQASLINCPLLMTCITYNKTKVQFISTQNRLHTERGNIIPVFNLINPARNTNQRNKVTRTPGYTRGEIMCLGGISIPTNKDP
jgi:hypothetical protein